LRKAQREYQSTMLAVRRTGETEALQALESRAIILNTRGKIQIVNRSLLVESLWWNLR
jgi:hypothetical protein